jgi:hypothetical protein
MQEPVYGATKHMRDTDFAVSFERAIEAVCAR